MRAPAPAYRDEGPHALWHFSENPRIERFVPRVTPTNPTRGAWVWAVDSRHAPLFWFPRECPRATYWAEPSTSAQDIARFFDGEHDADASMAPLRPVLRAHAIEGVWLERVRACRLYAYAMPSAHFVPDDEVGGYHLCAREVEPLHVEPVGDLLERHAQAGIELRVLPSLWPLWASVVRSTLAYSGSRLRNCATPEPAWLLPRT